jgi:hypothetical protein
MIFANPVDKKQFVNSLVSAYKSELAKFGSALPKKAREALIDGFTAGTVATIEELDRRIP